ncbi:MAG: phosphoadenylyl-sulfate reductase [Bacteroidales bacterium]|jgi:phosphoadenosine phosphosulfate reductase|nr:phosphoadenylyl-sulfate reductase [Bacteroidales bacterium]MDD4217123.1 phosphoadenylyl-sulfate reductase [Bacteroidales bacterium]MDY0142377.1 phosphoadenylyl-sulfate reductase [Bacteroidales bacterium]
MNKTELLNKIKKLELVEKIRFIANAFPNKVVFTTSFGVEDQVITDMIFDNNINVNVVSLDTGRLFEETYKVFNSSLEKYNKRIKVYYPQTEALEKLISEKGPLSFYESIENRKECCNIRKVEPLKRALAGMECWITGIRAEQSSGRTQMEMIADDKAYNLLKMNPLFDWSLDDVMKYLKEKNVPYNSLHHKGFVSVGCEPCTRAVKPGENFRAGRWWWENNSGKECGLHTNGK